MISPGAKCWVRCVSHDQQAARRLLRTTRCVSLIYVYMCSIFPERVVNALRDGGGERGEFLPTLAGAQQLPWNLRVLCFHANHMTVWKITFGSPQKKK